MKATQQALSWLAALSLAVAAPAVAGPLDRPETYEFPSRTVGTHAVGRHPIDLAFAPNGEAWVANLSDGTVSRLGPDGRLLGTHKVAPEPRKIAFDSYGNGWVYCWGDNVLVQLSPTGVPMGRFAVGNTVNDMAFDQGGNLWLASSGSNAVIQLAPNGRVVSTQTVTMPNHLAIDAQGLVWVASVSPKGTTNLVALGAGRMEGYQMPATPQSIAVGPDGRVWVTYFDSTGRVSRLSADRRRVDDLWTGFSNASVEVDRGALWVSNTRYDMSRREQGYIDVDSPISNTVSHLSPGGRVLGTYSVGSDAWLVKVAPGGEPWVVNFLGGTVTRLKP
ncbi:MAG: hypothetical protein ACK46X_12880 [Candidatus Sericytochromatia bacterium]